jgi:ATP-dependent exoDNAse (exonuclease V) alpha subunit
MAIYHLETQIIQRSAGRSAVACAAYRSGETLHDDRVGQSFAFAHADRVAHTEVVAPDAAPAWVRDRAQLWNQVELVEKRHDAQVARDFEVSLPRELNLDQQLELLRGWVAAEFTPTGAVVDFSIHTDDNNNNPHAHLMSTLRAVSADGWAPKKFRSTDRLADLQRWRESWEIHTNAALERAGSKERVDHRSHVDRGLDLEPTIKEGPGARGRASRGQPSDRVGANVEIRKRNAKRAIQQAVAAIVALAKAFAPKEKVQERLRALAKGRKLPSQQPQAAVGPTPTPATVAQAPRPKPQQPPAAAGPKPIPAKKPAQSPSPAPAPAPAPDEDVSIEVLQAMMKNGLGR